jgi:GNAT superfamily N-acetyltransferase
MHYVVREPETSLILVFCATYTTYADSDNERLLGSLAALLVRPSFQGRGIGWILHNHASRQLTKTRGVYLLQLGSTFPRLLYGLPADSPSEVKDWFRRRGWPIPLTAPGSTHEACDRFLEFKNWPAANWLPSSFTFRPCEVTEIGTVIDFVKGESSSGAKPGFYDQYTKLADHKEHIPDIVLGLEGETIIAAALTYCKKAGSPVAEDLPWADVIADDIGGVTCICIRGRSVSKSHLLGHDCTNSRPSDGVLLDTVLTRLLHSCICALELQGANTLLVDAVKWRHEGFYVLGAHLLSGYSNSHLTREQVSKSG